MRYVAVLLTLLVFARPRAADAQHVDAPALARSANPHGPELKASCSTCHGPSGWKPVHVSREFRHAERTFPLTGAHASATCASCHATLDFKATTATCASCHRDVHRGELGTDCARCHSSRSFVDRSTMTRMHQLTRFPLRAAHAVVACESCHAPAPAGQAQFARGVTTCISCHAGTFRTAASPPHVEPAFSTNCTSCHTTASWGGARFDHARTLFPLTGSHRTVGCAECHADKRYAGRSVDCQSCHQTDYDRAKSPPHTQGFPTTCASCHTTDKWNDARFDHDQMTRFGLTGAHRAVSCAGCHGDQVFRGKPTECVACHKSSYDQTTTPRHAAAGFSITCTSCHTTTQWKGAVFDHNTATRFVLSGAHRAATCASCHGDNVFAGKSTTCISCHQADYDGAKAPDHRASAIATTCQNCHSTSDWKGASFDHNATLFPLTGAHRAASCSSCHADGVYKGKPTACVSCHLSKYNATTTPSHQASGFPTQCETCHGTVQWTGATFDHNATSFPLTGAHRAATCSGCHADGVYKGKPTDCAACHQQDYAATAKPPHSASGIPTQCASCHTTVAWAGGTYNHSATRFPLTGAHLAATCLDCHSDGVYRGKPMTCITCHNNDWSASTNPHHAAAGFATTCESCHNTVQWKGGTFNHGTTSFPLTGAHIPAPCISCHASKVYNGLPTACVSCHLTDYNNTTNPRHAAANFPTTCQGCHNTTAWLGATFNHDQSYFPIYSGKHAGKWTQCSICHVNATNYQVFSCLTCHPHSDKTKTDGDHQGRTGYQYLSTACYACHPRGTH